MKFSFYIILLLILIITGCSDSLSPTINPDYSELQFKITRVAVMGSQVSYMEIYRSGWIKTDEIVRGEKIEGIEISMKTGEMETFRSMEREFRFYSRSYVPNLYWTDQSSHIIILIRENPDTTRVYDYNRSDLPESLRISIESVEAIVGRIRSNL